MNPNNCLISLLMILILNISRLSSSSKNSSRKLQDKDGEVIIDDQPNEMSNIYYASGTNSDALFGLTKTNIFSRNFEKTQANSSA